MKQVLDAEMIYKKFSTLKVKACTVRKFSQFFTEIRKLSADFRDEIRSSSLGIEMTRISEEKDALDAMYKEVEGLDENDPSRVEYEQRFRTMSVDFDRVNTEIEEKAASTFIEDEMVPVLDLICDDLSFEVEYQLGEVIFYYLSPFIPS
jgi:hypothetical protein